MRYFTIKELCASSTAKRLEINNSCTAADATRLTALVDNVLDPLREWYGHPIRVNSGYRSPKLNRAVGGASQSQHLFGEAADITAGSPEENKKLFEYIKNNLPFDQLIDEKNYAWLHVSYRREGNRKQILAL